MTPRAAEKRQSPVRSPRRGAARSERPRTFEPEIIALIRADIEAAHGKPEVAEPTAMDFIDQFFPEIHELREKKFPWSMIHERLSKYVDCSARTLQSYYNILATKRGVAAATDGRPRRGRRSKVQA
jgi:hypothetical protein